MLGAMARGTLGDDVYREDPTVAQLETRLARMFGKEAGLFVVSGTMANLLAISCHCPVRGLEVIAGDKSHTFLWEQGNVSRLPDFTSEPFQTFQDGTFDLEVLKDSIRPNDDPHEPRTGLIMIENTHNYCGGKVVSISLSLLFSSLVSVFSPLMSYHFTAMLS